MLLNSLINGEIAELTLIANETSAIDVPQMPKLSAASLFTLRNDGVTSHRERGSLAMRLADGFGTRSVGN